MQLNELIQKIEENNTRIIDYRTRAEEYVRTTIPLIEQETIKKITARREELIKLSKEKLNTELNNEFWNCIQEHETSEFSYTKRLTFNSLKQTNILNERVDVIPKEETLQEIKNLEKEKNTLIIQTLNTVIQELKPGQELIGAYWGGGVDYEWSKINGIKIYLDNKAFSNYNPPEGVMHVFHDLLSEELPFNKESQNIALIKTIGADYNEVKEKLWPKVYETLKPNALVITDEEPTNNKFTLIENPLNDLEYEWITSHAVSYHHPRKFMIYQKN